MSDEKLIMLIAGTWIANGGDSEGFAWSYQKILDVLRRLEVAEEVAIEEIAVESQVAHE